MLDSENIKVTVTMPVFNAESFVKEAIESVLAQDYANFKLLILDDGSTDDSYKLIKEYKTHPKVRLYSQAHRGIAVASNKLLKLSHGEYISPLDNDDIMLPGKLKKQADFLDRNPDVGVVHGKGIVMQEERFKGYFGWPYDKEKDLLRNRIASCSAMVRKFLILEVGGYDEILTSCIDYDLWLKLAAVTTFVFLDEFFFIHRIHKKNFSSCIDKKEHINNLRRVKDKALKRRFAKIL
ncbi:MAG: glycosyltransferase [Candidatus Omnitrophica bacterium]|nr:glycosyltransferase [Candidatus Omnitrophota bacterium]